MVTQVNEADYALAVKTGLQFPKPPCRVQHPSPQ